MFKKDDKVIINGIDHYNDDIMNGDRATVTRYREGARLCTIRVDRNGKDFYIATRYLTLDEHAFDPEIDEILLSIN